MASKAAVATGVLQWLFRVLNCKTGQEVSLANVLKSKFIGLYFTASWCPPCHAFIPILSLGYQKIREVHGNQAFEIVAIPLDTEEAHWSRHMDRMPWLALPLNQRECVVRLFTWFGVAEAPRLVIVDSMGEVICENARGGIGFGYGLDPLEAYENFLKVTDDKNGDEPDGAGEDDMENQKEQKDSKEQKEQKEQKDEEKQEKEKKDKKDKKEKDKKAKKEPKDQREQESEQNDEKKPAVLPD
eukprot:TRINITY_DN9362_c0_g1_i1.p1 TRINITY_DN9362_c0_g1~~TRINITY_DN9362_c0_g1_i1.p1  ORF type:complete len:242 (+),score=77.63 TRINITY_DN9362_c0_g1_i1:80-805(+)